MDEMKYKVGDIVIYGDEKTSRWGVIEKLDYKDIKIGIRSYYTETGHVEYWVRPECIIKCLNKYHVGDRVYCCSTTINAVVEVIGIRKAPCSDACWYKVQSVDSKAIYFHVEEEDLNKYLVESHIYHDNPLCIDKVIFNNPATIIIWKDGTKTVVKTAPGETYSKWAGMALCISKKLYGDRFHRIFKEYCGEEEEESSGWQEWHQALVDACKNMGGENNGEV